jgi:hexosaminidase
MSTSNQSPISRFNQIIPRPASVTPGAGVFTLTDTTRLTYSPEHPELAGSAQFLAEILRRSTGFAVSTESTQSEAAALAAGDIHLSIDTADSSLGEEGYRLVITPDKIMLSGAKPAGVFFGLQTLRQLLPPAIESRSRQAGPWEIPVGQVHDVPRFAWRGAMLDVARHFFKPQDVRRFIDLLALYKINRLHLHLSDDQGWRIMIHSWPKLAEYGGSTAVGGDPGGYYTQEEYLALVDYAASRYIMIVPEIDMPGHTNAALASYAELNCKDKAPKLYTCTEVGFSSLCTGKEITYAFLDDVIGEIALLTPGPYFHVGGDEARSTPHDDYVAFITRVQDIVERHGKILVGWDEVTTARLRQPYVAQFWQGKNASQAIQAGAQLIMSPAERAYLDMQYTPETPLGLHWAAYIEVQDAYTWDPVTYFPGVQEQDVLGIEAPLWSETIRTMRNIEYMVFPRLPGIAELGWSPAEDKRWDEYALRLAEHGPRFEMLDIHFYRSPQVPWR